MAVTSSEEPPRFETLRLIDLGPEDAAAEPRASARSVLLWLAGWTAFVLLMAAAVASERRIPFRYALISSAVQYYLLAGAGLIVWRAGRAMALRGWTVARQAAAHVSLGLLILIAWQSVNVAYLRLAIGPSMWALVYDGSWRFQMLYAASLYVGMAALTIAIQSGRRARAAERREHELALLARDAEVRALTAQLQPHFLLNTLNAVASLMASRPAEARAMVERLAALLTAALDEFPGREVALGRELDLAAAYLGIQQVRFGDRLSVRIDVSDALRDVHVPPFLLQPLVENAVEHGVAPFARAGFVGVTATRDDGGVRIEVADSGPGFTRPAVADGRGLSIADRRLRAFAPGAEIRPGRDHEGRFAVAINLPDPR